jgi:hypothetical protein
MGRYNYTKSLEKLTHWANNEGYSINFDHDSISYINWEDGTLNWPKEIKIESKYTSEIKVYILLHELGHHQLRKDWNIFEREMPILAHAEKVHFYKNVSKYKRRIDYIVSSLEEEFKAWDEGHKLGILLGIRINEKKWHDIRTKSLFAYMKYYSEKKR